MGFGRIVCLGLLLANRLLGTNLPESIERLIYDDAIAVSLCHQISSQLFSSDSAFDRETVTIETTLFHIKTRERWRDKISSFNELIKFSGWLQPTKRDRDLIPLLKMFSFLYYAIRPVRISLKYTKVLFKN